MSAFSASDFGDMSELLSALGLVTDGGDFNNDWLGDPESYLKTILGKQYQREALLDFIENVRDASTERDAESRQWIELFSESRNGSGVKFFLVVDDQPANEVDLFLGVRFQTYDPLTRSESSLMFPTFRVSKVDGEGTAASPLSPALVGNPGGHIVLTSEITISTVTPEPGAAGLGAVGLRLLIPTDPSDGPPQVGLTLRRLQLPGESTSRDLVLCLADPEALRDAGQDLIIALIRAQVDAGAGAQITAFARLIGLADDAVIPDLPVEDILARGVEALADWLADALGDPATRTAWLQALADLLANGASVSGDNVLLPVGGARLKIGVGAVMGASGRPIITLSTAFGLISGTTEIGITADLARIDLGAGSATAVPGLRAEARFDLSGVSMTDVSIDTFALGFGLDQSRRPVLIVEVRDAVIFNTTHARLDLTNPDAVAAAAAQAATDALSEVLGNLGPAGNLIAVTLGWAAPAGAGAGYPTIDLLAFLSDPLGALKSHWQDVLNSHAGDMPTVLASVRQLITGDATPGMVTGSGSESVPWGLPLAAGLQLAFWHNAVGKLFIGVGFNRSVDSLGERCTVIETRVRITLVSIALDTGASGFLPEITARVLGRARGGNRLSTDQGGLRLEVDHIGILARWTADAGLSIRHEAPNPAVYLDEVRIPMSLPDFSGDFDDLVASLTEEHWDALERIAALLTRQLDNPWLNDLVEVLGWRRPAEILGAPARHRLRLAALISDAPAAIRAWLADLLADGENQLSKQLEPLAKLLSARTGTAFSVEGCGSFNAPWRIGLANDAGLPAVAVWREPDVPLAIPDSLLCGALRNWRPGSGGLDAGALAGALLSEYPAITGPFGAGITQEVLNTGLQAIAELWLGSDGLVRPPSGTVPAATLHLITNQTANALVGALDLAAVLGTSPATTITVQVLDPDVAVDPSWDSTRILDMRETGRDPLAFTPLPASSGDWHILLAPRSGAALDAGDPDGVLGQVARLKHGLSLIAAQAGAVVVADAPAGHAAWLALDEMGAGLDTLVVAGLPVEAGQAPVALAGSGAEMLRRLAEFLPEKTESEPDDPDLAAARSLIAARLGPAARNVAELSPPSGWTGAKRAGLDIHLLYGVFDVGSVRRAMTAVLAAGLSLNAQRRSSARASEKITSASFGAWVPLSSAMSPNALAAEGHALVELLGVDIDASGALPLPKPRQARRLVIACEIRRQDGWLFGGPATTALPLKLELRSVEISLRTALGGTADASLDRCDIILHGLRIEGRAFPRLVLSADVAESDLGIDGLAAPATPEIRELLSKLAQELTLSGDTALTRVAEALRAAGILGSGDSFDAMSLSNWIDDPAARVRELLSTPALRNKLETLLVELAGGHSGLSFDPATGKLGVALNGTTGESFFGEWSLSANAATSGSLLGSLRLGRTTGTNLAINFAPFSADLNFAAADAGALGGLPATMPLWPSPDLPRLGKTALPTMAATAFSRLLDGLRNSDLGVKPVLDAALAAFGLIEPRPGGDRVVVPPLLFIKPGLWLKQDTVFGDSSGTTIHADRVIAVMDALRPFVNLPGSTGVWRIESGIELRARNDGGLVLDLSLDPSQFLPASDVDFGGSFGLRFTSDGRLQPAISTFVGLSGGSAPGRQAVHLSVTGSSAHLFLRNAAGTDLEIYPDTAGLAQLTTAGIIAALPAALDAIVDTHSAAGDLLADVGDALSLRSSGSFDAAALSAWASDPVTRLENRWPQLLGSGLSRLAPALPPGINVTSLASGVRIQLQNAGTAGSTVTLGFNASPFSIELGAAVTAIPFLRSVNTSLAFDATGLIGLSATLGPAEVPLTDSIDLRPVVSVDVGSSASAPNIAVGLAVDAANTNALALRYAFDTGNFSLGFGSDTPAEIAGGIMHFAIDLIGSFIMELDEMRQIMNRPVGSTTIRELLAGVALTPNGGLDAELFRVIPNPGESASDLLDSKLARVFTLLNNIVLANPSVTIGGELSIGLAEASGSIGLSLNLTDRLAIVNGDVSVWLENDNRWIIGDPPTGVVLGLIKDNGGAFDFDPALSVNGLGIRVGRSNAPLLDSPIALGSIAFHVYAAINDTENLGGAQVQLSEIAVAVGSAQGDNSVAQGMLAETNDGDASLAPAFSPALSIQTRPSAQGGGIAFRFVAGDGEGPWWLPIRSQFGPIYIDQIGLGTQTDNDTLQSLSLLFDGNVSIAGLEAAVDDLGITYRLDQGSIFDASSWKVDLAGLAISADISGVSLAGGLRKFEKENVLEYIGMLTARFATYGLSIFGGYASVEDHERYSAFFAFGAVLGPFGGPPAFFLTGIGGGLGINRDVVPPTDMAEFDDFVMIAALDPSFNPPGGLMEYMGEVRDSFPPLKGRFWFAAGISFTSFALVDGIAVVAVEFGQGFELSIFGLARMALPRPEAALVSIELGLVARFSSEDGVIWVQAQLTDNSWLLHRSARLTGGFAYVSWFKGDKAGEFVLTLGGYHPNFKRDGYPVVPRLGFNWSVSNHIVIKAETYFALTSEAVMAGGLFEASAKFGPAFAHLSFGGNAIVYFDPFWYEADAHARVSAGIRIKTFLGTIKLSFSLGAYIEVAGPEFHGRARIEVGPIDITVRFGNSSPPDLTYISWVEFSKKYLELAPGNVARVLTGIAGRGALPPASGSQEEAGTPDGSSAHPYDVMSEFELSFTSTVPISRIFKETVSVHTPAPTFILGISPCDKTLDETTLTLRLRLDSNPGSEPYLMSRTDRISVRARATGKFPIGVWGTAPDVDHKKLPKGEVITATEGVELVFKPRFEGRIPLADTGGVSFEQVEPGTRKPLPLRAAGSLRARLASEARIQRTLLQSLDAKAMSKISTSFQSTGRSATARRSWSRERSVPMRVGLLSERIVASASAGRKRALRQPTAAKDRIRFGEPRLRGMLARAVRAAAETTASTVVTETTAAAKGLKRVAPPVLSEVMAAQAARSAVLLRSDPDSPVIGKTLVATGSIGETIGPRSPGSRGARRASGADLSELDGVEAMVRSGSMRRRGKSVPHRLTPGRIAVFDLPGAKASPRFENSGTLEIRGIARLVVLRLDGRVELNAYPAESVTKLPKACRAFAVFAGAESGEAEVAGWLHGSEVAYLGQSLARCHGGFVHAEGASRTRGGKRAGCGWMSAGELTDQSRLVETSFDQVSLSVAVVLDGIVTARDLASFALSFDGVEVDKQNPLLVPFDGKTFVVHALQGQRRGRGMSVRVAGLAEGALEGVIAARMPANRLVSRIVNGTIDVGLEALPSPDVEPVTAFFKPPEDIEAEE
jgi:large repetitive protein